MKQDRQITLGLIQSKTYPTPEENLSVTIQRIKEASQKGAEIVCLQELFRTPYFCQSNNPEFFKLAEPIPGPTSEILSRTAKEYGLVIVGSLYEKADRGNLFNTAIILDADGKLLGKYRKIHIPDDLNNHYSEKFYFMPGDLGFPVFQTRFGKIGVLVCWDQWYPEGARELALKGAEIIFYPTAIGWQVTQQNSQMGDDEFDGWVTIQRAHAIANGVFVAACNRTGHEQKINFWGGSFVCDPFGRMVSQASHDKEEIVIAKCDMKRIEEVRKDWPFLVCRRIDAYSESKK